MNYKIELQTGCIAGQFVGYVNTLEEMYFTIQTLRGLITPDQMKCDRYAFSISVKPRFYYEFIEYPQYILHKNDDIFDFLKQFELYQESYKLEGKAKKYESTKENKYLKAFKELTPDEVRQLNDMVEDK